MDKIEKGTASMIEYIRITGRDKANPKEMWDRLADMGLTPQERIEVSLRCKGIMSRHGMSKKVSSKLVESNKPMYSEDDLDKWK